SGTTTVTVGSVVGFNVSSSNGSESVSSAPLTVSLSQPSSKTVTVAYGVTGGTATGGGVDYTLASGTLSFAPGETSKTIALAIMDDVLNEANETVQVALSNPTNILLSDDPIHTFTILDNDPLPSVGFAATSSSGSE